MVTSLFFDMYRFSFLSVFLLIPFLSFAQIIGKVFAKEASRPLADATIAVLKEDKSVATKTFSSGDGTFMLLMLPAGKYQLSVSFIGYKTFTCPVSIATDIKKLILPDITLQRLPIDLSQVNVKSTKALLLVKTDTLEFSAKDFPVAENASLQNLIEKVPGLYVDANGDIFYQGKQISDFYLDGRRIQEAAVPGMGKRRVTQELLAGLADKIQVIDRPNLSGISGGTGGGKILNITVRKEMKKGINGSLGAGYGTGDTYNAGANTNLLREDKQIMLSASSNNVNSTRNPSSTDEAAYLNDWMGGVMKLSHVHSNLSFDLGKKIKVSATVLHQMGTLNNNASSRRDNLLPDSVFHYNADNFKRTSISGDNIFANAELQATDRDKVSVGFNGTLMNNQSRATGNYLSNGVPADTINYGQTANLEQQDNKSINVTGNFNHRLKDDKTDAGFSWNIGRNHTRDRQQNYTLNLVPGTLKDTVNQQVEARTDLNTLNLNATLSRSIGKGLVLNAGYNFTNNLTRNDQATFDYDGEKQGFFLPDAALSYQFENINRIHVLSTGLLFNRGKLAGRAGVSFNTNHSVSRIISTGNSYDQQLNYVAPTLDVTYKFSLYRTISMRLSGNPSMMDRIRSLLPVVSTANPLYVQLGNPDIKPAIDRQIALDYRQMDVKGFNFSASISATMQRNGLSTTVFSDESGRQLSKPVNVDGNYNMHTIISAAKRFNAIALSIDYNSFTLLRHSTNFVNNLANTSTNYLSDNRLSLSWMLKKLAEVSLTANLKYFGNRYSLQTPAYSDFILYKTYLGLNVFLPLNLNLGTAVIYTENTSQKQQFTLLNAWVSKTFLRDKSLQLKVYGYDLFAQNKSIQTVYTPTFIESSQSSVLEQFFMVSATYFFGKR